MPSELAIKTTVKYGSTVLKTVSGGLNLVYDEPSDLTVVLDNSAGAYGIASAVSNPRTASNFLSVVLDDDSSTWTSPDFVLTSYDLKDGLVTLKAKCKLHLLTKKDQSVDVGDGTATLEDTTVADALTLIGAAFGFTFSGAPTRDLQGPYHLVGTPLQWIQDILGPTHVIRMGAGNQILVESATSHTSATALVDRIDLEDCSFRRTSEIYNKATVERLVETGGLVTLFDQSRSGGDTLGLNGPMNLSEPTRYLRFDILDGYRGVLDSIVLLDSEGDPILAEPLSGGGVYLGTQECHAFRFTYTPSPDANDWGTPWTPNWRVKVVGYPLSVSPVPTESYSATATVGSGSNPYPKAFSSLTVSNQTDAQAAATALAHRGSRLGTMVNIPIRLRIDFPLPNQKLDITDNATGLDAREVIIETTRINWANGGDTGTINLEASISEAA